MSEFKIIVIVLIRVEKIMFWVLKFFDDGFGYRGKLKVI